MKIRIRFAHWSWSALVALSLCVFEPPVLAQECPELVGRWGYGKPITVAIEGDFVYIGSGSGLLIADVSNPSMPQEVGHIALPDVAYAIAVLGDHAYIADLTGGLRVIDVSMPSAPVEVGAVDTLESVSAVAVSGGYAYVAERSAGLAVIDVSTPSAPSVVGLLDQPRSLESVAVSGTHAFAGGSYDGLRVIDVSTPSAPVEVGFVPYPGACCMNLAVSGDFAYLTALDVTGQPSGLHVIDVSTPSSPVEVGFLEGSFSGVAISDGYAYASNVYPAAFHVIDVTTPSAPVEVAQLPMPCPGDAAVGGGHAYVAAYDGVFVIDVSTPTAPQVVSSITTPGYLKTIAVSGGYAYVSDSTMGLRVIDVRTPTAPASVGSCDVWPEDIAVRGDYAYLAGPGLQILDISTPSAPQVVGSIDVWWGRGVAVSGGYAYVAADTSGLRVIDISIPSEPVEVGFVDFPGVALRVAVDGDYAYVANRARGLRIIDVSTPSAPVVMGQIDTPSSAYDVAVSDSYAYVASYKAGLRIVDVSDPSAPVEVGFLDSPGDAEAVAVSRGYAYVARHTEDTNDEWHGLWVIDVSTPTAPVEAGFGPARGHTYRLAVSGGYVYLTQFGAGLSIYSDCAGGPILEGFESFFPAAAVAAGAQGAFFQTDLEINNTGTNEAQLSLQWLPRGEDNSESITSDPLALAAGHSLRWENVLGEAFGLSPDSLGALRMVATTEDVIGMSRTYNIPGSKAAGTFGQGLPAIRATEMTVGTEPRRIILLSENDDSRANVGCVNGTAAPLRINIGVFDAEGTFLETKSMDLAPYSNNQINRIFRAWEPVNGYVDVWADSEDALYYCYGSMLDNLTSDPTTILPQVPSDDTTFIPAAALAAGLEGAFFSTDIDLNNVGSTDLSYQLLWLPRGEDNSEPVSSETFSLASGAGVRYANVLDELFGLEPDQVGALAVEASGPELLAMSRTYNLPPAKVAGTFGQELPGIPADRMIASGVKKRIIFMNENDDVRSNVGCVNGSDQTVRVFIELFDADGESLETRTMDLAPYSNNQITRVFRDHAPIAAGYVDVWTTTPGASIYCYGSVLDNSTSDPTTVLPQ